MPHHAPHRACALLAGLAALATASTLHAQTRIIYVDDDAHNPDMDGSSWELAYNDLQYALYDISSGGGIHSPGETEIRIAQGVYTPSPRFASRGEEFHFHGSPASGVALTVLGGFAGLVGAPNPDQRDPTRFITVLSGDLLHNDTLDPATWTDNSRQIAVADDVAGFLMDGLTFKGARGADHPQDQSYGGALRISGRTYFYARRTSREDDAVVRNCRFIDNVAGLAGGVLRCLSSENSAGIRVESCDFISNRVLSPGEWTGGGAIAAYGGVVVIEDCRFLNNAAPNRGGAVYGGVAASLLIRDSLFISNTAGTEGGAICTLEDAGFEQPPQIIDRCTFTRNAAPRGADIAGGTIQVTGSILHDDEPGPVISRIHILPTPEGAVHIATLEFTDLQGGISALTGDTSVIRWLQGNIDLPPRFDQTFHLQPGSPCIDAGSPRTLDAIQKDLQGQPRVFDGDGDSVPRTDMGASEWQPAPCPADFDNSGYVDTDDFDVFIRAFDAGC